ncbi:uncharacterized protein LOC126836013 [Adelges cooleyi]|uniref:uncharacterized protein LOC126836013 n=1 Tax=Adelges cooleyi TaxID=133065 RepID=UPI0021805E3C|nr:uncharacterized protein LOC126836013 [Adelges cooleyi]
MFELNEEFDLDDEVFLSTQMVTGISPLKTTSCTSNVLIEEDDDAFFNISNSISELEPLQPQNVESKENISPFQRSNINNLKNSVSTNRADSKSNTSKLFYNSQASTSLFQLDTDFDSDDEAFLNSSYTQIDSVAVPDSKLENNNITPLKAFHTKDNNKSMSINSFNTTVTSVKSTTPKSTSRKFPGPAGLLSENENVIFDDPTSLECLDVSTNIIENEKNEETLCVPLNDSSFTSSPYQQFLSDFITTDINILLDKYNVAWIKQKLLPFTASGRFFTYKIPFFVSVVQEIDCLSPDPTVLLADKTGQIGGTIHRDVWAQLSSQLKAGTVLVLSNVGVSCQRIVKGFTLNITSDHMISVYSYSADDNKEVIVTRLTNLTNKQIVDAAKRWNVINLENMNKTEHCEIIDRSAALSNLKFHDSSVELNVEQGCHRSSAIEQLSSIPNDSSKGFFKPKIPMAQHLLQSNPCSVPEEPPAKKIRNECDDYKTDEKNVNNEVSVIQSIFEEMSDDALFDDFYC